MTAEEAGRIKLASPEHDIHELLRRRWSPRAFDDRPIDRETLLRLLEAARWAPSSFNEQPWRFVLALREETEDFERVLQCLNERNRAWAGRAAVLGISVAKLAFERNARPNRHAFHDVGLAMGTLIVQATALGIAVHQMAGFDESRAREVLGIPDGFDPVAGLALGYPGSPEILDEKNRDRETAPRSRLPLSALAFRGTWGEPL